MGVFNPRIRRLPGRRRHESQRGNEVRALSLWQPWASLIADGRKRYETRHWSTKYRGPLAIHAAKHIDRDACQMFGYGWRAIPTGCILCVVELTGCLLMTADMVNVISNQNESEYVAGNWAVGRYAWQMLNPVKLDPPCPIVGRQGLFEWKP